MTLLDPSKGRPNGAAHAVTFSEASRALVLTMSRIGQLADEAPSECIRLVGNKRLLVWRPFIAFYKEKLQRSRSSTVSIDAVRVRKLAAEAELTELDLAERRGELIEVEKALDFYSKRLSHLRNTILNLPARFASRTVGLDTLTQSQQVWSAAMVEALNILRGDGPDEAERTA